MSGTEKQFENKIKRYIVDSGGWMVKFFANAYTRAGIPDVLACINGRFIAIEVKAQNGRASPLQISESKKIRAAGGLAYIVYPSGWTKLKAVIDGTKLEGDLILK